MTGATLLCNRRFASRTRRAFYLFVLFLVQGAVLADTIEDGVRVLPATNLALDGSEASSRGLAILLEFAADDCPYCALLEEEFLKPMLRSGEYDDRIIMRVIDIGRDIPLTDFSGEHSSTKALADRFDVGVTPTVVLVDGGGAPLVDRIVGIWSTDFFGGVLDQHIDAAVTLAQRRSRASVERRGDGGVARDR